MRKNLNWLKDEKGLVSIFITMILIVVISLVVLGFAQVIRREQRQSLDRQLSTQAFYAAESGINDAAKYIKTELDAGRDPTKTDCNPLTGYNQQLDADGLIQYTCVFIDPFPNTLEYSNISTSASSVTLIQDKNNGAIDQIKISWQNKDGYGDISGCRTSNDFPPSWPANCKVGLLRVDLVPVSGSLTRDGLVDGTMTAFFYPEKVTSPGAGSLVTLDRLTATDFTKQGVIKVADCEDSTYPKQCSITITNLGGTQYMLRLKSIYQPSSVTISASRSGSQLRLKGAQAIVDATGKANDVLRRIQVRAPISGLNSTPFPEFGLETPEDLCKQFSAAPPSSTYNGYTAVGPANCDILH